nr:hypothetical protein BaRGS_022707 [Batillaria attramentaria]
MYGRGMGTLNVKVCEFLVLPVLHCRPSVCCSNHTCNYHNTYNYYPYTYTHTCSYYHHAYNYHNHTYNNYHHTYNYYHHTYNNDAPVDHC